MMLFTLRLNTISIQEGTEAITVTNCVGWSCGVWWLSSVMVTGHPNKRWK